MGNISDREKNRNTNLQHIKKMIKPEIQIEGQTDLDNDFPQYAPVSNDIVTVPEKEEARSKRVNLLIKPSVHKEAQRKCNRLGISLNECINQLVENWVKE